MMTPKEYAFWPDPENPVYGLLFCEDEDGKRWTLRGDPEVVKMIRDTPSGVLRGAKIGGEWESRPGWPDEWDSW